MFEKLFEKRKLRMEAVSKAREDFSGWLEISRSNGWKIYHARLLQKVEYIKNKLENDMSLTGEELKRLQLALQAYNEVIRIPKELENNANQGGK